MEKIIFDLEKFKTVILYIISKYGQNIEKMKLFDILYFSDFNFYEIHEIPITGEKYFKESSNPVPIHFSIAISQLVNEEKIEIDKNRYSSKHSPNLDMLSIDELNVIDNVIMELSNLNFNELKNYCQGDLPWRLAKLNKELNYEAVFYREPEYSVRDYSIII